MNKLYDIGVSRVNTLIRPDGLKKAFVRLSSDHDALDVANKVCHTVPLFQPLLPKHSWSTVRRTRMCPSQGPTLVSNFKDASCSLLAVCVFFAFPRCADRHHLSVERGTNKSLYGKPRWLQRQSHTSMALQVEAFGPPDSAAVLCALRSRKDMGHLYALLR